MKRDRASELRAIADGRLMLNVRNGVTVSRSMLAMIADEIDALRAAPLAPAEVSDLVERLQLRPFEGEYVLPKWAREREQAAALIQLQAARIAELEAGLEPFAKVADELTQSKYGPAWGFNNAILEHEDFRHARSLLNGERKG